MGNINVRELTDALGPFVWMNKRKNSMGGSIIPTDASAYDIGSATKPIRHLYVDSIVAVGTGSSGIDERVAASAGGTAGYLGDKLAVGSGMGKTVGSETVIIDIAAHTALPDVHHAKQHAVGDTAHHNNTTLMPWAWVDKTGSDIRHLASCTPQRLNGTGGLQWDIVGWTSDGINGITESGPLRPSYAPGAAQKILMTNSAGLLTLEKLSTKEITTLPTFSLKFNPAVDVLMMGNTASFRSETFSAGTGIDPITGFSIYPLASPALRGLSINTIKTDEFRTKIFVADEVRIDRGILTVAKGYGITSREFTVPSYIDSSSTVYFENSPTIAGGLFAASVNGLPATALNGDWVLFRYIKADGGAIFASVWGQVWNYAAVSSTEQSWTFTLRSAATDMRGFIFKKSSFCLGYGASGQGTITLNAVESTGAPVIDIQTWSGDNPYSGTFTTHARLGKLIPANDVTGVLSRMDGDYFQTMRF